MRPNQIESAMAVADEDRRPCARCGYDLRGLSENRCPECGTPFDAAALPMAEVPWLCRNQSNLGAVEAYVRTVWLVLVHPKQFASQIHRPYQIDKLQAQSFTTVSIWIATVSFVGALVIASWLSRFPPGHLSAADLLPNVLIVGPGALVFFMIATRVDSSRVSALPRFAAGIRFYRLSHYCCAALGLMPMVPIAVFMAGAAIGPDAMSRTMLLSLGVIGLLWWISGIVYSLIGGKLSLGRTVGQAMSQLFLCFSAAVVGVFVMIPLAILTGIILSFLRS